MAISIFDLFKIGIGPSSSHTVGPMRAAAIFVHRLASSGAITRCARVRVSLYGSLGATGQGHGSGPAVLMGLEGEQPESFEPDSLAQRLERIETSAQLLLNGSQPVAFNARKDVIFHKRKSLPFHPNGMTCNAFDTGGELIEARTYFSVGGGFVVDEEATELSDRIQQDLSQLPYHFTSAAELLRLCSEHDKAIWEIMLANELHWRSRAEIRAQLLRIWQTMQDCVRAGIAKDGILPGGLKVKRRARALHLDLQKLSKLDTITPGLQPMDWVNLYALAVNEENAAGGRVVTAPTNGAAGIVPAVLHYYRDFCPGADDDGVERFLLTAGAIGILYKENASISGAEVGCQGEVGSACSMAAAGLAELWGGSPEQIENAAEIAMEHHLGLTCDPIGGLVQIPCIERNAMAAVHAINAARMALRGDGSHFVSLDQVIKTMRDTGADMKDKYKETARGGLAVNVIEC